MSWLLSKYPGKLPCGNHFASVLATQGLCWYAHDFSRLLPGVQPFIGEFLIRMLADPIQRYRDKVLFREALISSFLSKVPNQGLNLLDLSNVCAIMQISPDCFSCSFGDFYRKKICALPPVEPWSAFSRICSSTTSGSFTPFVILLPRCLGNRMAFANCDAESYWESANSRNSLPSGKCSASLSIVW